VDFEELFLEACSEADDEVPSLPSTTLSPSHTSSGGTLSTHSSSGSDAARQEVARPLKETHQWESDMYYVGLPSRPRLVGRSGAIPWEPPTGPEAYARPKQLRNVGRHPIVLLWDTILCPQVVNHLDSAGIRWTSVDVVRIGYMDEPTFQPVIVWVGVEPGSLSFEAGTKVALSSKRYFRSMISVTSKLSYENPSSLASQQLPSCSTPSSLPTPQPKFEVLLRML
jgi:hypothetical protein